MATGINFHHEGSGPPLVLMHGVGHHWQVWLPVIELLRGEFEIFACDTPGFGRSAPLRRGLPRTMPYFTDAFEEFFAEHGLDRPHVAGNSMGGGLVLELARRRAVSSACAFCPVGFASPLELDFAGFSLAAAARPPQIIRRALLALARTPARRVMFWQLFGHPGRMPVHEGVTTLEDAWASPSFINALRGLREYSFTEPLALRGFPLTVAWGQHDRLLLYRRQSKRARAALPWARHVTLGAGHVPFYDDPAACAEVIRRCAARVPAAVPAV